MHAKKVFDILYFILNHSTPQIRDKVFKNFAGYLKGRFRSFNIMGKQWHVDDLTALHVSRASP